MLNPEQGLETKTMAKFMGVILFFLAVLAPTLTPALWIWTPESGKFVNPKWEPKKTAKLQMEHARSLENKREYEKAAYEYKKVAKFFPASAFAPEGQMALGRVYEKRGQYYEAYLAYKSILEKYPSYGQVDEILDKIYRIGNDFLSGGKRYLWKFKVLSAIDKASEIFEFIVEQAPYSELAPKAQLKAGFAYQKVRDYNEAVEAFEKVIENYPKSDFSDNAKFQVALTWYTKSKGPQYDQEATDNAIKEFLQFKREYPESEKKEEAVKLLAELEDRKAEELFMNGVFYEKAGNFVSSKVYYELLINQYPDSKWTIKAKKKISSLRFRNLEETQEAKEKRIEKENLLMDGGKEPGGTITMPLDEAADIITGTVEGVVDTAAKPVKIATDPIKKILSPGEEELPEQPEPERAVEKIDDQAKETKIEAITIEEVDK